MINEKPSSKIPQLNEGARLVQSTRGRVPHLLWEDGSASVGANLDKALDRNPNAKVRGDISNLSKAAKLRLKQKKN